MTIYPPYRQQPPIINQPMINPMMEQPPPEQPPMYEPERDVIETYGSIIKDLTDTDKLLNEFELRLRGKMKDENGKVVTDPNATAYIKTDQAARDFVNLIKSMVNRHTDFSYYDQREVTDMLDGASAIIPEWLMYQGDNVPKGYRMKIGFEAMAMVKASICKAQDGRMLKWSKGAISEQSNLQSRPDEKKGIMDYIFPFKKKGYSGG